MCLYISVEYGIYSDMDECISEVGNSNEIWITNNERELSFEMPHWLLLFYVDIKVSYCMQNTGISHIIGDSQVRGKAKYAVYMDAA